jgi:hypothetical protein
VQVATVRWVRATLGGRLASVLYDKLRACGDLAGDVKGLEGKAALLALTAPRTEPNSDESVKHPALKRADHFG